MVPWVYIPVRTAGPGMPLVTNYNKNVPITKDFSVMTFYPYACSVMPMEEKGGFDIVISNPPYIRIQGFNEEDKKYLKDFYHSAKKKFDTYILFIERGLKLLKDGGYFGFIIPNLRT